MILERVVGLPAAGAPTACVCLIAAAAWLAPAAGAEVTAAAQTQTANAAFLARAVPPGPPAGICLVDTGVDTSPDTAHVHRAICVIRRRHR